MHMLILVQGYPSLSRPYNLAYVHARVLAYQQAGFQVTVLSFGAKETYLFEGIEVNTEKTLPQAPDVFDLCVAHAPNLRNHLRWLWQNPHRWRKTVWVIHGHEVLIKQQYYPPPYDWDKRNSGFYLWADKAYDLVKVRVLAKVISAWIKSGHLHLVFVSEWMKHAFLECVPVSPALLQGTTTIAPNPVHPAFLAYRWEPHDILADFVTIRPLDEPKYAIDQVATLAMLNPDLRFDVFGQGRYFQCCPPPANLHWHDRFLNQEELPGLLQHYRAALMPTRLDAQGVMCCEMAMLGMPILTSDLPICREMLADFPRVGYLRKPLEQNDLSAFLVTTAHHETGPLRRFANSETIEKEIQALKDFSG